MDNQPLNEYTKEEWLDLMREICPAMTVEEFDEKWERFLQLKQQVTSARMLN